MKTSKIKLTEAQLNKVIKKSIQNVLNEMYDYNDGLQTQTDFDDLYNLQHHVDDAIRALEGKNKESYNRSIEIIKNIVNNLPIL